MTMELLGQDGNMSKGSYRPIVALIAEGLNPKTVGSVSLGFTENGTESFHPVFAVGVLQTAGGISIVPVMSIGTNSTSYNNIISAMSLVNMLNAGSMVPTIITSAISKIAPGTEVKANISIGATATGTPSMDVLLFGYYN